jgi:protein-serine/threonine kinase
MFSKQDESGTSLSKQFQIDDNGEHHHSIMRASNEKRSSGLLPSAWWYKIKDRRRRRSLQVPKPCDHHANDPRLTYSWPIEDFRSVSGTIKSYGRCHETEGSGAFGVIWKAVEPDHQTSTVPKLYAIKEFRRQSEEDEQTYRKRVQSEFCISSSLEHTNVVSVLDLLSNCAGNYCEVMEFCAGGDLHSLVRSNDKLDVVEADCFFLQLMRGVQYIHTMGVAHRDLKPENLLLTASGTLKVADFGSSECFRLAWETEVSLTIGTRGSAPYSAPEEHTGEEFDPRAADIWACGVIYMVMRKGTFLWLKAAEEDHSYETYCKGRKAEHGYKAIETLHRVSMSRTRIVSRDRFRFLD